MSLRTSLLALLAWTFVAASAPASTPVSLSADTDTSIELAWPVGASACRFAMPSGTTGMVQAVRGADGRAVSPKAVSLAPGRFRRLDISTATLDPAQLAGVPGPWRVFITFVDGDAPALSPVDDIAREQGMLRTLGLVNEVSARRYLADNAGDARRPMSARSTRSKALGAARAKIAIDADGMYRVTFEELQAAGATLSGTPIDDLRLMSRGTTSTTREIALRTSDANADGLFGAGDWIELWGEALIGEEVAGYFQRADFTDVNAYFLDVAAGPRLRMGDRDATPIAGSPAPTAFLDAARWESNDVFLANHRTGLADVDHFYSCPSLDTASMPTRTVNVPLPGLLASHPLPAAIRVQLLARSGVAASPDHFSEIRIGAASISTRTADGPIPVNHDATGVSAAVLADPAPVEVRLPGIVAGLERAELNWIEIDYPRAFGAVAGRLDFEQVAPARVTVTDLPAGAEAYDVTDPVRPERLLGVVRGASSVELQVSGSGVRRVTVVAPGAQLAPRAVTWVPDTGLADASNAADLLVIGPAAWTSPPLPGLQRYADWRATQGVRVKLASFEAAVDELNDGLFSPAAVGRLVSAAVSDWAAPPQWVLLLGDTNVDYKNLLNGRSLVPSDCSATPDPCGHAETEWVQLVPTHIIDVPEDQTYIGYLASDSIYAMASGADWTPDVALGRLPARTASEIEALLDKVVRYEQMRDAPPAWATRYMTVGDEVVPGQEIIETSQDDATADVPACYQRDTMYYQRDWNATNATGFTTELLGRWAEPARSSAVISYVGHGNTFSWSGDTLLTNAGPACRNDAAALTGPGMPEPILLNADCVAGGFMHLTSPSLLEELVRAPSGGAIAAFGPTGVTDLAFAGPIVSAFYGAMYGPNGRGSRLGDVILSVQAVLSLSAESGAPEEMETNALLGDPSLLLVVPFAPPAGDLRAISGDAGVELEWDAVAGATAYRLYRSETGADGPWIIAADALTGTSYTDTGLTNARAYHYALEPLDGCMPGRWSASVAALPCDPAGSPLPPSGLTRLSTSCDGSALLQWTASPTPGITQYVLVATRAGTSLPPEREKIATGTFATLDGLVPFRDYLVTVAGLDACGIRGAASAPLALRITCPITVDAPAFISDLRLRRQGSDIAMTWSPVTTTIQGAPLTPVGYDVHRAARPDFVAASSIVDRVSAPAAVQPGRVGTGLEFYTVSAVDTAGVSGPVGHDLPLGVRGLYRADAGTDYSVTWRPVEWDLRGERTPIARYEVYASLTPITRAAVEAMTPAAIVTVPEALVPQALGGYHVVVAVDVHGNRSAF